MAVSPGQWVQNPDQPYAPGHTYDWGAAYYGTIAMAYPYGRPYDGSSASVPSTEIIEPYVEFGATGPQAVRVTYPHSVRWWKSVEGKAVPYGYARGRDNDPAHDYYEYYGGIGIGLIRSYRGHIYPGPSGAPLHHITVYRDIIPSDVKTDFDTTRKFYGDQPVTGVSGEGPHTVTFPNPVHNDIPIIVDIASRQSAFNNVDIIFSPHQRLPQEKTYFRLFMTTSTGATGDIANGVITTSGVEFEYSFDLAAEADNIDANSSWAQVELYGMNEAGSGVDQIIAVFPFTSNVGTELAYNEIYGTLVHPTCDPGWYWHCDQEHGLTLIADPPPGSSLRLIIAFDTKQIREAGDPPIGIYGTTVYPHSSGAMDGYLGDRGPVGFGIDQHHPVYPPEMAMVECRRRGYEAADEILFKIYDDASTPARLMGVINPGWTRVKEGDWYPPNYDPQTIKTALNDKQSHFIG
jgi:hypothetical protein